MCMMMMLILMMVDSQSAQYPRTSYAHGAVMLLKRDSKREEKSNGIRTKEKSKVRNKIGVGVGVGLLSMQLTVFD